MTHAPMDDLDPDLREDLTGLLTRMPSWNLPPRDQDRAAAALVALDEALEQGDHDRARLQWAALARLSPTLDVPGLAPAEGPAAPAWGGDHLREVYNRLLHTLLPSATDDRAGDPREGGDG